VFDEDDLLPISALQHLLFCERQCALIHLEGVWEDNAATAQGSLAHMRVDEEAGETRHRVRIARGLPLRSLRLGLAGRADVVEFHPEPHGAAVAGMEGGWRVLPIEYKRGWRKEHRADEVQLCAEAICLEEMLGARIERGALFYGKPRRRTEIVFDAALRGLVEISVTRLRELVREERTPFAVYESKCDFCSLVDVCMPKSLGRSAAQFVARSIAESAREEVEPA
jgi:CRISPR-associated exonuclease Cas4